MICNCGGLLVSRAGMFCCIGEHNIIAPRTYVRDKRTTAYVNQNAETRYVFALKIDAMIERLKQ
jgi:hypothetical protein